MPLHTLAGHTGIAHSPGTMTERTDALARMYRQFQIDILYGFGSRAREVKSWLDGALFDLSSSAADVDVGVKPVRGVTLAVLDKVRLALALMMGER